MPGPGNILITVGADTVAAVKNLGNVNDALGDTMTRSEKMGAGLKKAALPAAAVLGGLAVAGFGAAKAAMADAASSAHLAATLKRVTGAGQPAIDGMEDWITKTSMASGVADDELRPALEKLATTTGSTVKAQALMAKALDISAATGKDVDTVATGLAKAYQGQTGALVKLVPGISESARKSKDFSKIMDEVTDKTKGASKAYAETAEGGMKRMNVATGELQESLGAALLPAIEAVIPVLIKMAEFAQDNVGVIKILIGVVGGVAAAIVAANVAMKVYEAAQIAIKLATTAWTGVQWLLNAALNANPIGAITLLVVGLGAAIVIAYQKSETFRDVVKAAMDIVRGAVDKVKDVFDDLLKGAKAAFDWITDHWKVGLFAFGPIGAAVLILVQNWEKVKDAVGTVVGAFKDALGAAQSAFNWIVEHWQIGLFAFGPIGAAVGLIATQWDKLRTAAGLAKDAVVLAVQGIQKAFDLASDAIADGARSAISWLTSLYDKANTIIRKIQDVIAWIGKIPKIPGGGIFDAIIPGRAAPAFAGGPAGFAASGRAATPAPQIVINVSGALDPDAVARQIERLLDRHRRRQGN